MMAPRFRTLAALVLAVALAGCADGPTAASGEAAPDRDGAVLSVQATSTLSISMFCEPGGYCEAYADGGSGGYSFTWDGAEELADSDGWSIADPYCFTSGWITITATLTDSSGSQVSASDNYYC